MSALDGMIANLCGLTEKKFAHIITTFPPVADINQPRWNISKGLVDDLIFERDIKRRMGRNAGWGDFIIGHVTASVFTAFCKVT